MELVKQVFSRKPLLLCLAAFVFAFLTYLVYSQGKVQVGYALIEASTESSVPVATALFSLLNSEGVLVSEAGVSAVEPIDSGRIFVDQEGVRTGIALVNPSQDAVTLDLSLRDQQGNEVDVGGLTLQGRHHLARFVDELFPGTPQGFSGSLIFRTRSQQRPVAAMTIRQGSNIHGEPLIATLPVAELDTGVTPSLVEEQPIIFPHIGAGDILSTQIILINRSSQRVSGRIRFRSSQGAPLALELDGIPGTEFPYRLQPEGVWRRTLGSSQENVLGYAEVTVEEGLIQPAGTAVFQYRSGEQLVSEAGVGAIPPSKRSGKSLSAKRASCPPGRMSRVVAAMEKPSSSSSSKRRLATSPEGLAMATPVPAARGPAGPWGES